VSFNEHTPVLLNEVLSFLEPKKKDYVVVDMTLGRAGHSLNILKKLNNNCVLYGFDRDIEAIDYAKEKFDEANANYYLFHSPFSKAVEKMREVGLEGVDFILYDIGVSSPQFDDPKRGFSYRFDGPLDMRMDQNQKLTAETVVNSYSESELRKILFEYGDEPFAGPISKAIVNERNKKPIKTTYELVNVIKSLLPEKVLRKKGHPAKKTFMALRYEVNDEKRELINSLKDSIQFLNHKGRVAVITFNSEEDRIVKNIFKSFGPKLNPSRYLPESNEEKSEFRIITKKAIKPSEEEMRSNPRSESASMRVLERE